MNVFDPIRSETLSRLEACSEQTGPTVRLHSPTAGLICCHDCHYQLKSIDGEVWSVCKGTTQLTEGMELDDAWNELLTRLRFR